MKNRALFVIVLITIACTAYIEKEVVFSFLFQDKNPIITRTVTTENVTETLRNRPFPLAGTGNDAGMETGDVDITPINRELLLETYSVGTSIITRHGVRVSTKYYNLGNQLMEGYGHTQYNPSPKTYGIYNEVKITLENTNKISSEIFMENIKLIDQEKREYLPREQTTECGLTKFNTTKIFSLEGSLEPNVPCTVGILFEVATSAESFLLQFDIN